MTFTGSTSGKTTGLFKSSLSLQTSLFSVSFMDDRRMILLLFLSKESLGDLVAGQIVSLGGVFLDSLMVSGGKA